MSDSITALPAEEAEAFFETAEEISAREGIYGEIKRELVRRGIPAEEIAFIHDFPTPARKAQAFADCNAGRIRVIIASTEKAGTGVNMQERLFALHHLDTPWRPSDIEQREGRILRQGNVCPEVHICQYITEGSFDGYMWQTLESKARFISQIMAGEVTARTADDIDDLVMTAAQIKAIASGNPRILEKVGLEVELTKLERLYSVWLAGRRRMSYELERLPREIEDAAESIRRHQEAVGRRDRAAQEEFAGAQEENRFRIDLRQSTSGPDLVEFSDRSLAGKHLRQLAFGLERAARATGRSEAELGSYRGFKIFGQVSGRPKDLLGLHFAEAELSLRLDESSPGYPFRVTESDAGVVQSMDAALRGLDSRLSDAVGRRERLSRRCALINQECGKGWEHATAYHEMRARLDQLNRDLMLSGEEVEPSPELARLGAEALLPAPEIKVRQLATRHEGVTPVAAAQSYESGRPGAENASAAAVAGAPGSLSFPVTSVSPDSAVTPEALTEAPAEFAGSGGERPTVESFFGLFGQASKTKRKSSGRRRHLPHSGGEAVQQLSLW
jgi:hypothetical protein